MDIKCNTWLESCWQIIDVLLLWQPISGLYLIVQEIIFLRAKPRASRQFEPIADWLVISVKLYSKWRDRTLALEATVAFFANLPKIDPDSLGQLGIVDW